MSLKKITTNLWFNNQAEEATQFYTRIFKNSKIGKNTYYGKERHEGYLEGQVMTIEFQLENMDFVALNGGPVYQFSEAISFIVSCETQAEIDYYWDRLSEGADPKYQVCGWLKDKFGVSWQIVPSDLTDMITDPEKGNQVMKAMLQMKKIDMDQLRKIFIE